MWIVARYGEMDGAGWWNTNGSLGRHGALALQRGVPSTHHFAQARIAFAVAHSRCHELFDPPGCMTLWNLPARIEDQFEAHWQDWLDEGERCSPFFTHLAGAGSDDLLLALAEAGLVDERHLAAVGQLRRSAEGPSVPLPGTHQSNTRACRTGFAARTAAKPRTAS
ncbi:BrxE family protein [Thiocapsa bogorovii]|uniref:BrxE family protein n=1 Tax=Thiocapsa bogorovii TaxID=521689 RepID=UPI001E4FDFEF|nr:BrxE family protein [Thiocapsa bogorovii]UHD18808.1 BrxE family protein [Thiocapsa bogorovii]